jgi:hypothetical protein
VRISAILGRFSAILGRFRAILAIFARFGPRFRLKIAGFEREWQFHDLGAVFDGDGAPEGAADLALAEFELRENEKKKMSEK